MVIFFCHLILQAGKPRPRPAWDGIRHSHVQLQAFSRKMEWLPVTKPELGGSREPLSPPGHPHMRRSSRTSLWADAPVPPLPEHSHPLCFIKAGQGCGDHLCEPGKPKAWRRQPEISGTLCPRDQTGRVGGDRRGWAEVLTSTIPGPLPASFLPRSQTLAESLTVTLSEESGLRGAQS